MVSGVPQGVTASSLFSMHGCKGPPVQDIGGRDLYIVFLGSTNDSSALLVTCFIFACSTIFISISRTITLSTARDTLTFIAGVGAVSRPLVAMLNK